MSSDCCPGWLRSRLEPGSAQQVPHCQLALALGALSLAMDGFTTPNSFLHQRLWVTTVFGQVWEGEKSESLFAVPRYSSLPGE